jgi:hypothetical protein
VANVGKCEEISEVVAEIESSVKTALVLVNDMLTVDKIRHGKLVLDSKKVLIWPLIETTISPFYVQVCWEL